jgi:predicted amidohydrolase YtcJ
VANSLALKLAGITRDSKDPAAGDGHIERDGKGEPTGILWYSVGDAIEEFAPASPPIPELSAKEEFQAYKEFFENLRSLGITSVNIAGSRPPDDFRVYQELHARYPGELPRMTIQPWLNAGYSMETVRENLQRLEGFGWRTGAGNEWVKLGAIKMGLDGGYTFSRPWPISETAHLHVPTYYGGWRDLPDNFYLIFKRAHELGWQIGVHTAGDRAAKIVTDVLERVITENPRADHRHHLIHFEVGPSEETYQKMKKLGIGVSMQPNFTYALQPFFSLALQGESLQRNNPSRSVLDHGLRLSYGSDERPYGPLIGLYAAVTRRGYDGKVYGPEEAVTIQEAVRAYTIDAAWNEFDENNRGSIEPGKLADFVVLSDDIFSIDPLRIKEIKILNTILGGRVFEIPSGAKNRYYPDHP